MQVLSAECMPAQTAPALATMRPRASRAAAAWALGYALYRAYYAVGGTWGMFGIPAPEVHWRFINGVGAVILLGVAITALATPVAWRRPSLRTFVLALCWLMTVGFVMHAMVGRAQSWSAGLSRAARRRWWVVSALIAILALTCVGLLSATGVIGRFIVG